MKTPERSTVASSPGRGDLNVRPNGAIVEPNLSLFSLGQIRVAVVRVGTVSDSVFELFLKQLENSAHIKLKDVKSFYTEEGKSPFEHLPWNTGSLHFRFVPDAAQQETHPMAEVDTSRRFMAVIGIFHAASIPDVKVATEKFECMSSEILKGIPMSTHRLFGFEPSNDDVENSTVDSETMANDSLVIFPRKEERLELDLGTFAFCMHDFAGCMLMNITHQVLQLQHQEMNLDSYMDRAFPSGSLDKVNGSQTKRQMVRKVKRLGDLCLLAASPGDAIAKYNSAIESGRLLGDWLFVGSACEGLASAILLAAAATKSGDTVCGLDVYDRATLRWGATKLTSLNTDPSYSGELESDSLSLPDADTSTDAPAAGTNLVRLGDDERARMEQIGNAASSGCASTLAVWEELREPMRIESVQAQLDEAIACYTKKSIFPCVAGLKLKRARYLAGLKLGTSRNTVTDAVMDAVSYLDLLSVSLDQQVLLMDGAAICGIVGAARKRSFLLSEVLRRASTRKPDQSRAQRCCSVACLGLDLIPGDMLHDANRRAVALPYLTRADAMEASLQCCTPPIHWKDAYMNLLKFTTTAAVDCGMWLMTWSSASLLLREFGLETRKAQEAKVFDILERAATQLKPYQEVGNVILKSCDISGPPPLVKFNAWNPRPAHLQPVILNRDVSAAAVDKTFMYKPTSKQEVLDNKAPEVQEPIWVLGDEAHISCFVTNPCHSALPPTIMCLSYSSTPQPNSKLDTGTFASPRMCSVQVPGKLHLAEYSMVDFVRRGTMTLKLKPKMPGYLDLTGVMVTMFGVEYWQPWSWTLPGESMEKKLAPEASEELARFAASKCTHEKYGIAPPIKLPKNPVYRVAVVGPQPLLTASISDHGTPLVQAAPAPSAPNVSRNGSVKPPPDPSTPLLLTLIEGQCTELQLDMKNCTSYTMDTVRPSVEYKNDLTSRNCSASHALVHFHGVHASISNSSRASLQPHHSNKLRLYITAGSLPTNSTQTTFPIKITISYWSEACQPRRGHLRHLTSHVNQALGRQLTLNITVHLNPNLTISSLTCSPLPQASPPPKTSDRKPGQGLIDVYVRQADAASKCNVTVCHVCDLKKVLDGADDVSSAVSQFIASQSPCCLPDGTSGTELQMVVEWMDVVKNMAGRRGGMRPPLLNQLQAAAKHLRSEVVVVWQVCRSEGDDDQDTNSEQTPPRQAWGIRPFSELILQAQSALWSLRHILEMPVMGAAFVTLGQVAVKHGKPRKEPPEAPFTLNTEDQKPSDIQVKLMQQVTITGEFHSSLSLPVSLGYSWQVHSVSDGDPSNDPVRLTMQSMGMTAPKTPSAERQGRSSRFSSAAERTVPDLQDMQSVHGAGVHCARGAAALDAAFLACGATRGQTVAGGSDEQGTGLLSVTGMFARAGTFMVSLGLESANDGRVLAVDDYASSVPVTITVTR